MHQLARRASLCGDPADTVLQAVKSIERNVEHNGEVAQRLVTPSQGDARIHMLQTASEAAATRAPVAFDVVDLDPYGAPVQLLDSAVQAVSDGGLLMVTATDMAVLCGNNGEACFAKYGSYPLHRPYGHEQAIRILLASIETHAARHKRHIVPLLG